MTFRRSFCWPRSEQSPLDLVSVDRPSWFVDLLATIHLQVRSGAHLLYETANNARLVTVRRARCFEPAPLTMIRERQLPPNAEQQELMRHPPVIAGAKLRFRPDEARLVLKSPGINDLERIAKESVRRPKMQMRSLFRKLPDGLLANCIE